MEVFYLRFWCSYICFYLLYWYNIYKKISGRINNIMFKIMSIWKNICESWVEIYVVLVNCFFFLWFVWVIVILFLEWFMYDKFIINLEFLVNELFFFLGIFWVLIEFFELSFFLVFLVDIIFFWCCGWIFDWRYNVMIYKMLLID